MAQTEYMPYFVLEDVLQDGHGVRIEGAREDNDVLVDFMREESARQRVAARSHGRIGLVHEVKVCGILIVRLGDGDAGLELVPCISGFLEGFSCDSRLLGRREGVFLHKVLEDSSLGGTDIPAGNNGVVADDDGVGLVWVVIAGGAGSVGDRDRA